MGRAAQRALRAQSALAPLTHSMEEQIHINEAGFVYLQGNAHFMGCVHALLLASLARCTTFRQISMKLITSSGMYVAPAVFAYMSYGPSFVCVACTWILQVVPCLAFGADCTYLGAPFCQTASRD